MNVNINSLKCCSFSTKRGASASMREKLCLPEDRLQEVLSDLLYQNDDVENAGLLYLATCHRIELYSYGLSNEKLLNFWETFFEQPLGHNFLIEGQEVLRHLARVASSLDSEVLGETQITGQVKKAIELCRKLGVLKGPLDRLAQHSLRIAKSVRTHTEIGRGHVSVAHAAIDGLFDVFESLEDKDALVVGAGSMALQALERLIQKKVKKITWVNRSKDKLLKHELSEHCQIADFHNLSQFIWEHDISVVATSSPHPIISKESLKAALPQASVQSLTRVLLDLGLPRNIDEKVHGYKECYVRNVDEFRDQSDRNSLRRQEALESAENVIKRELEKLLGQLIQWDRGPLIEALGSSMEFMIGQELADFKLEKGAEIDYIARSIKGKLMHKLLGKLDELEEQEALDLLEVLVQAWRQHCEWPQKKAPKLARSPQKALEMKFGK